MEMVIWYFFVYYVYIFLFSTCWSTLNNSGILIWTWADATNKGSVVSVQQIIYDAIGLFATIAATVVITVYSKRALRDLQDRDFQSHKDEGCINF